MLEQAYREVLKTSALRSMRVQIPSPGLMIRHWIPRLLQDRAKVELDWSLKRKERLWYTFKGVICLLLHLNNAPKGYPDRIEIAHDNFHRYSHHEYGEAADWDYFAVGYGIRKGWWYYIDFTGYP